jgi:hypothetical protein
VTESDLAVLVERLDNLKADVKSGQDRAEHWREHFDAKLDARPCEQHNGYFQNINKQLSFIWWLVSISLIGFLSIAVAWGAIGKQVEVNTGRWERYFQAHPDTK